jgi:hypothetical protein
MNKVTVNFQSKRIKIRDLIVGQYGILNYGGEDVVVVKTIIGLIGLDGYHSWSAASENVDVTPIRSGDTITIKVGE